MNENTKVLVMLGAVFAIAVGFQIATNYIPSIIEGSKPVEEQKAGETVQEDIKIKLQSALDKYIEQSKTTEEVDEDNNEKKQTDKDPYHKRNIPKSFAEFVSYQENKPDKATISLEDYQEQMAEDEPVKGLDSKTLVIRLVNNETKKPETYVYLLNTTHVSLADI